MTKMRDRLFHWSSRLLSSGGKLILLCHVLTSMPMYLLQVLCPPKDVIQKLERICNAFLWDKLGGERGIRWRSWDKCCYAVTEGGLGFRSFANMSRVFACKLWLRLRTRDSIWADFMHSKYIKGEHPMVVKVSRPPLS